MSMIEVLSPGLMLSVQDAGRKGLRAFGVSAAGPMDAGAAALANVLVGNDAGAAGFEFAGHGGRFRATRDLRIAVTGGEAEIRIGARMCAAGRSLRLRAGEELVVGGLGHATWGYLAVSGGIDTPPVLGSRATHLRSGLGGVQGRSLQAGDRLPLGPDHGPDVLLRPIYPHRAATPMRHGAIRVVPGPQDDMFAPEVMARFLSEPFTVTPQRDRMAMVMGGPVLPATPAHDIVSDGSVPGSIQVPGSGHPLILMAESQTTGGYPKIATVIGADLGRLAQMRTGAQIRFEAVSRDQAEDLWIAHRRHLDSVLGTLVSSSDGGAP